MQILCKALANLGLNEKEARVYLALLQSGKNTSYAVSKISGLKKSTTYVILDQLVAKGFAYKIPRYSQKTYKAESPEICLTVAKERLNNAQKILPELMAIKKKRDEKVSVAYYEGLDSIKEMYSQFFNTMKKKPIKDRYFLSFQAHTVGTPEQVLDLFDEVNETKEKLKIKSKNITVHHSTIIKKYLRSFKQLKKYGTEIKALDPNKYSSSISIRIYANYVEIFSHRHIQGVIIQDADVADALTQ
ncbi:MAG: hypothetical protein GF332_02135, partial [Candidatus Moranbacteria bacterium]|nr:hypothetical protein [Candidatus Moranbacteria bacterium]